MSTISSLTSAGSAYLSSNTSTETVLQTSIPGLAQTAVSLAAQEGIVATLSGAPTSPVTYDAVGMLNALIQAGTTTQSTSGITGAATPQSEAQSLINQSVAISSASSSSTSGIYNASGTLSGSTSVSSANWASVLQANPSLSATLIADSVNQGIVGTLSTAA